MSVKLRILVTRPPAEAKGLIVALKLANFAPVALPTIEIHPINNALAIKTALLSAHKIIFISRNAVKNVAALALTALQKFSGTIFAIGSGTAAELYALDINEVSYPPTEFNSEALLDLPELDQVLDEHIVIFSGLGGRELLHHTLIDRGADVTKIATYERCRSKYDSAEIKAALQRLAYIISTSGESLQNLIKLADEVGEQTLLFSTPLLVISKNMLELAKKSGFNNAISVALKSTDAAIMETLLQWTKKPIF